MTSQPVRTSTRSRSSSQRRTSRTAEAWSDCGYIFPSSSVLQAMPSASKKSMVAATGKRDRTRSTKAGSPPWNRESCAIGVAQVAAAVARGQEFLADAVHAFQQHHGGAAAGGADGGHQARTAAADYGHLIVFSHAVFFRLPGRNG